MISIARWHSAALHHGSTCNMAPTRAANEALENSQRRSIGELMGNGGGRCNRACHRWILRHCCATVYEVHGS
jgi:hypothetical protein